MSTQNHLFPQSLGKRANQASAVLCPLQHVTAELPRTERRRVGFGGGPDSLGALGRAQVSAKHGGSAQLAAFQHTPHERTVSRRAQVTLSFIQVLSSVSGKKGGFFMCLFMLQAQEDAGKSGGHRPRPQGAQ